MYQLLIVDDQPDLVEDLATMLPWNTIGIGEVYQAGSGMEAIEVMRETPIDIVITDIRMPGLSGLELIAQIREDWSHVKCILLSGYNDFEYAQKALKAQASDYLLKPVEDGELLRAVSKAIDELESRWREAASHKGALASLKDNLPIVRSHLLASLLKDHRFSPGELAKKLDMLELPVCDASPVQMLLLRMEGYFVEHGERDGSLFQYAICNMAEEILGSQYKLWHTRDDYGYYVFVLMPMHANAGMPQRDSYAPDATSSLDLEQNLARLQHYVKLYLKGTISIVLSKDTAFPAQVSEAYDRLLAGFRQRIGSERDFLFTLEEKESNDTEASTLAMLYQPPLLYHLLEAGQWDAATDKLNAVFDELEGMRRDSHEHILEVYYAIASSLSYAVHKNKWWMADILGSDFEVMLGGPHFHTIAQLRAWTRESLGALKSRMADRAKHSRSGVIGKVQEYAAKHLDSASLQTIADHVYLNPSYLSKVYKLETGEGISDYLSRLRLETAAHLLRSTPGKIYEIAAAIGYQKTSYFIKVFKDRFGVTPQEFRDR